MPLFGQQLNFSCLTRHEWWRKNNDGVLNDSNSKEVFGSEHQKRVSRVFANHGWVLGLNSINAVC